MNDDTDNSETLEAERPRRERKAPECYGDWVTYAAQEEDDPKTTEEALSNGEKEEWTIAMMNEIESLHKNEVWDIVDQRWKKFFTFWDH